MSLILPCSGKLRFLTEGAALRKASWTNAVKRKRADKLSDKRRARALKHTSWIRRAYQCPHCAGWHLTSQTSDQSAA